MANNLIKLVKEGQAQLQLPKTVFYNPVQEFNRDLSVLVLRTYLKYNLWHHKKEEKYVNARGGLRVLDALSASGLRSIRYAKELNPYGSQIKEIVANDLSQSAVDLIKRNIELNGVQDIVRCSQSDAAHAMHLSSTSFDDRFHVIDIDPFGTGAQFFDAAVSSIGEAGLLMVTCTDTAVLCGNASESCFARYGSMSLRADFCHEAALRIILKSLESHASVYGRYIKPLLSISVDFYVRLYLQVFSQQAETKKSASKLSQIYFCKDCKTHELNQLGTFNLKADEDQAKSKNLAVKYKFKQAEVKHNNRCQICSGKYILGGPIWSAPMHNKEFLLLLKQELALEATKQEFNTFRRMQGIVHMCSEELDVPLFYTIDHIASILKVRIPKSKFLMSALINAGYKVSQTHTNRTGLKTDAPSTVVWDIFCQLAHGNDIQAHPDQVAMVSRIMNRPRDKTYDFTYNSAVESDSRRLEMLRFQVNPERDWGPKTRPLNESAAKESDKCDEARTGLCEQKRALEQNDPQDDNMEGGKAKKRKS